jgi:hypothetical protein
VVRRLSPLLLGLSSPIVPAAVEGCCRYPTRDPPHEAGMGGVVVGSSSAGSTHDPPYEQLLVGLEAGAGSMFRAGGGRRVSVT